MRSRQTLTEAERRDALARVRAFARGELDVAGEIRRRFVASAPAGSVRGAAAVAAARAVGQAAAVPHMGAHALGAAAYAARAAALAEPDRPAARAEEIRWQLDHMSAEVEAALRQLPPVGEDRAGPLGPGLLSTGDLGTIVRELQASLRPRRRSDPRAYAPPVQHAIRPDDLSWITRPHEPGEPARHVAELSEPLALEHVRANVWRYEPGAAGRRHRHPTQAETFVCLAGTLTMYLGDPPVREDVPAGGAIHVPPGTPLQTANHGADELVVYAHGWPPESEHAELLDSAVEPK